MTQQSLQRASQPATATIVTAVAEVEGVDPTEIEPPLSTVIETDALNTLLDTETDIAVEFRYRGHDIVAHADGSVDVQ